MDFAEISARVAATCFAVVGDAASYQRTTGEQITGFKAALNRNFGTEGHIGQRRLTAHLPISIIGSVARDDLLFIEGGAFVVKQELARDQDMIEVLLRDRDA